MNSKFTIISLAAIIAVGTAGLFFALNTERAEMPQPYEVDKDVFSDTPPSTESTQSLKKFSSVSELRQFLSNVKEKNLDLRKGVWNSGMETTGDMLLAPQSFSRPSIVEEKSGAFVTAGIAAPQEKLPDFFEVQDYSTTNIQVKNVDEPDFLKNDGKYVYILSQNTLTIIDAYPAENAKILHKIALDIPSQDLQNMFLDGDRLVIFYQGTEENYRIPEFDYNPQITSVPNTHVSILDVSDRENPKIAKQYVIDGSYYDARMIGDTVYLITSNWADYDNPIIPRMILAPGKHFTPDVYYFDNIEESYNFNTITSFDVAGDSFNSETFLMGQTNTIYVSEENIYITYQKNIPHTYYENLQKDRFFKAVVPLFPKDVQDKIRQIHDRSQLDWYEKWNKVSELLQETYNKMPKEQKDRLFSDIQKALEGYDSKIQQDVRQTAIHKIALDGGKLQYLTSAEVPGTPLNQFSMDEHNGKFRIATTSESYTRYGTVRSSNVYVLDENLKLAGSLEKIAPDESIFSARFMENKLYLVTFQRIDPFFVIDLSQDTPKILGALKIPGFSNYLHPYDDTRIIGIGRDTKDFDGRIQQTGIKIAMFDVSDFNNPIETDAIVIGDGGTDSEILNNHKAFLLDKNKDILSIPIKGSMVPLIEKGNLSVDTYYSNIWYGFYVYGIDKDKFDMKGKVAHYNGNNSYNEIYMPARSFYIGNTLYTVMDGSVKMNDINDIHEINSLNLRQYGKIIDYLN